AGSDLVAQRLREVAQPAQRFRLAAHRGFVAQLAGRRDLFALDRVDLVEDVAHAALNLLVTATNWLSLASALPEATASRAIRTPSVTDDATFAQYSAAPAFSSTMSRTGPSSLANARWMHCTDSALSAT